jgi:uncharacterized protein (DUF58 family)
MRAIPKLTKLIKIGKEKQPEKTLHIDVVALIKNIEMVIKMLVNMRLASRYRSVFKGKGLEFEDYRVYTPNDDSKLIDWKASMRAKDILIKLYKEERNLDVYFLVDSSASMIFGSTEKLKLEYGAEVAAALAYFVMSAGDKAGLIMFSDRVVKMIRPSSGRKHFYIMLRSLVDTSLYGGSYNLGMALKFLIKIAKERGVVVIVSDFIGLSKGWEKIIKTTSANFDVIGIMVRDPRDEMLPEGVGNVVIEDPYSGVSMIVNTDQIKDTYRKYVKKEERMIRTTFLRSNADFLYLSTDKPFTKELIEFFIMRRRRLTTWI